MWNWPETFVVDDGWQDFRSENLLVETEQILEKEIHLVAREHLKVQTEEFLEYTMTETIKEHRSLPFASNNETSEDASVHFAPGLQNVQQGKLFQETMSYACTLLLQEGTKCLEVDKSSGSVNEQFFALQEELNGIAMYQKLCHGVVTHDKSAKGNTRNETQTMNSHFGKKTDFDFKLCCTLFKKLSRVVVMYGTIGLIMETLGWTQWHKLMTMTKLN